MFQMLADHPDFAAAERAACAFASRAAHLPDSADEHWAARGLTFKQGYGLTGSRVKPFDSARSLWCRASRLGGL